MYSKKSIDRDFEIAAQLIQSIYDWKPDPEAMDRIKSEFIAEKGHLFPFFDENGMRHLSHVAGASRDELDHICTDLIRDLYDHLEQNPIQLSADIRLSFYSAPIREFCNLFAEDVLAGKSLRNVILFGVRFPEGTKIGKMLSTWMIARFCNYAYDTYSVLLSAQDVAQIAEIANLFASWLRSRLDSGASIYLSINPADFLLQSDHTSRWTSCHSLLHRGMYHTATLSYMLDGCTIVAYAATRAEALSATLGANGIPTPDTLREYRLPVKQWRQLVHLDADPESAGAICGRQFPDEAPAYARAVHMLTEDLLREITGLKVEFKVAEHQDYCMVGRWEYMDFSESMLLPVDADKVPSPIAGCYKIICPFCGRDRRPDENGAGDLHCSLCDYEPCNSCGSYEDPENMYYVDGAYYCSECFNELFTYCAGCGALILREEATYNPDDDQDYCEYCASREEEDADYILVP